MEQCPSVGDSHKKDLVVQTEDILKHLEVDDTKRMSDMLHDLVSGHRAGRGKIISDLEDRYEQKNLPIQTRISRNPNKIDERIPNDFFADIVDTKQGYMGNEVTIEADDETAQKMLHDFHTINFSVDQNSELVKAAARDGVAYRLLYVPLVEGKPHIRVKQIPASEVVLFKDESLDETVFGLRFWYIDDITGSGATKKSTKRTVVEWYDREFVTFYIDDGRGNYSLDTSKGTEGIQPHLFAGVPIVPFRNNEEELGEAEKVVKLIDAYDTITSATVSEVEQFRLAYLALKDVGGIVSNEMIKSMEQTGILPLGPNGDAHFITKDAAIAGVKILLDELRINIYQFARSIDLSKDYGGDLRVIGWQVALLNLENSCKVTERKFEKALREQYRMVCAKWKEWGTDIDYLELRFEFTRNFPKDLGSEAKILIDLLGAVSRETAYRLVGFVDDPAAEAEAVKKDSEFYGTMDTALQDGEPVGATEEPPAEQATDVTEDVQAQALNGAQIKSVVEIVSLVATKQIPESSAIEILKVAIPSMSDAQARAIIGPAARFEVKKDEPENRPTEDNPFANSGGEQGGAGDNPQLRGQSAGGTQGTEGAV